MIEVKTGTIKKDTTVNVPGSKSHTHRLLIACALANGVSSITNGLRSEDTLLTLNALRQMGVTIDNTSDCIIVNGTGGKIKSSKEPIYLANSGTSMRLLTAVASIGEGRYLLTGTDRMQERPVQDLVDGLYQLGANVFCENKNGCPPVFVEGNTIQGGHVLLNCSQSSQYLSALLLIAPYLDHGIEIDVTHGPVSKPYIDMTINVMKNLGIEVEREGYGFFRINGGQIYRSGEYTVEPDYSQAGYFWAAAAITGTSIKVKNTIKNTNQGDIGFIQVLDSMGCEVLYENDGITVTGNDLRAVKVDMSDMPDIVPTLAVTAAFANGMTRIENVAHLKVKESDRLGSVVNELKKMDIKAECSDTGMTIEGGAPRGAEIETYKDHRMAMSFALAGLRVPGIFIMDEMCVEKSFPEFWDVFDRLYEKNESIHSDRV